MKTLNNIMNIPIRLKLELTHKFDIDCLDVSMDIRLYLEDRFRVVRELELEINRAETRSDLFTLYYEKR